MRCFKTAAGMVVTIGALAACTAPALATTQFTASRLPKPISEAEPGKTKGHSIGSTELGGEERSQELKFGEFYIVCSAKTAGKTIDEGAVSWATSLTFSTEVKFEKCLTRTDFEGFLAGTKTKFNYSPETKKAEPIKFVYHVNGFVGIGTGETESEVEVGSGNASFSIAGKVCKIEWPRQTVPAKAVTKPNEPYSAAVYGMGLRRRPVCGRRRIRRRRPTGEWQDRRLQGLLRRGNQRSQPRLRIGLEPYPKAGPGAPQRPVPPSLRPGGR